MRDIRQQRGEHCEACGAPARYGHHIIPVSETGINSVMVLVAENIMLLCDDCHGLMHPLLRNVSDWQGARVRRGQALNG